MCSSLLRSELVCRSVDCILYIHLCIWVLSTVQVRKTDQVLLPTCIRSFAECAQDASATLPCFKVRKRKKGDSLLSGLHTHTGTRKRVTPMCVDAVEHQPSQCQ